MPIIIMKLRSSFLPRPKCHTNLFKYAGSIDTETLRQNIPENSLYVNFGRNKNDLFIWTADQKYMKSFMIENGYASLLKFINEYNTASASGKDTGNFSKEMAKILQPFYPMMEDKKMLLISTDSDTEKIPFENYR